MSDKKEILTDEEQKSLIKEITALNKVEQVFFIVSFVTLIVSSFRWFKIGKLLGWFTK